MFRGRVVDISHDTLMIEISGQERKIEAFIELMRPYGILELARTGRIALVRGTPGQGDVPMTHAARPALAPPAPIRPGAGRRCSDGLKPGQRIRITQTVRVGSTATWTATVEGVFRDVNYLATGLATDRVPEDDIVVVAVHFTKDNGELSSVTLDENSKIEVVG